MNGLLKMRAVGLDSNQETRAPGANLIRPRILSLSCAYPSPLLPGFGLFVQRRLQHLAQLADSRVVSPLAIFQYGGAPGTRIRIGRNQCPRYRQDGNVVVLYPRWVYPPLAGSLTAFWLSAQLLRPLMRLRKSFPFEIIDTHFGHPEGIAGSLLSLALRVPFTMTLRGNEPNHMRSALARQLMGWAVRRAARVFTVSERLRQFAIRLGADERKVKTVPNGVDTSIFYPRDRESSRVKHGFDFRGPLIVSAGALIERKGHHRIVQALKKISTMGAPVQLAIVGGPGPEGQYEKEIRRVVSSLDLDASVRFVGAVSADTMAEFMSAANVFCLASTREGWPNVVHEALACGTPVVATDVGAVPDMLPDDRYGMVVPALDGPALEKALSAALQKEWDRPAIVAWGQARSWLEVAREVLEEMQAVVTEERQRVAAI